MTQSNLNTAIDVEVIKDIVAQQIGVPIDVKNLELDRDLYAAGLTSLATVGLMLALEDRFDVEFPDSMLGRGTFRSISSISDAISKLLP